MWPPGQGEAEQEGGEEVPGQVQGLPGWRGQGCERLRTLHRDNEALPRLAGGTCVSEVEGFWVTS